MVIFHSKANENNGFDQVISISLGTADQLH